MGVSDSSERELSAGMPLSDTEPAGISLDSKGSSVVSSVVSSVGVASSAGRMGRMAAGEKPGGEG